MIKSWGKLHREISPKGRERILAEVSRVLSMVLRMGLTLQLALGIFWILGNFRTMQPYAGSYEYLEAAVSMRLDISKSFLYPLFLRVIMEFAAILHLNLFPFVYMMQLLFAWFSCYMILKIFPLRYPKVYACFLCTIPMLLQCHMAVLPNSLALSLLLLLVSLALDKNQTEVKKRISGIIIWFLLVLLVPAYGVIAFPVLLWIMWQRLIFVLGAFGLTIVLCMQIPAVTLEMTKVALERVSWPILNKMYPYWSEEIWEIITPDEAQDIALIRGGISEELAPRLTEALGNQTAEKLMRQITKLNFDYHSREVSGQILQDGLSCIFPPMGLAWELSGRVYASAGGRNYEIMKAAAPGVTKVFVAYGNIWFAIGGILMLLQVILFRTTLVGAKHEKSKRTFLLVLTGLPVLGYGLFTGGGMMDYKRVIFITWLWGLGMCTACEDLAWKGKYQ
jgi:hypothetical protein